MLRMPLNVIPMFIVQLLQTRVALDRIDTFLRETEVSDTVSSFKRAEITSRPTKEDLSIGITDTSFAWNKNELVGDKANKTKSADPSVSSTHGEAAGEETPSFELRDINVIFPTGELSLVTGGTASGKSALLKALLGEMVALPTSPESSMHLPKNPSQVEAETGLRNCISYCAQTPWLEHTSIRENILFGAPFESQRYDEVINCCALRPDLDRFEDGDETEIGSRGVTLSGGQKARVALARAVYARTKHVLLDDPLAAGKLHFIPNT